MTIAELVAELGKLFPKSFSGPEGFDLWAHHYRHALGQFEGPKLRVALDDCLAGWGSHYAPKPADILAKLNLGKARALGDWNAKEHFLRARREDRIIREDWWRLNSEEIAGFIASFSEEDRDPARGHVREAAAKLSWIEAQRRTLDNPPNAIVLSPEQWQLIRGRVESQRRASGFGNVTKKADSGSLRRRAKPLRQSYLDDKPAMGETA